MYVLEWLQHLRIWVKLVVIIQPLRCLRNYFEFTGTKLADDIVLHEYHALVIQRSENDTSESGALNALKLVRHIVRAQLGNAIARWHICG